MGKSLLQVQETTTKKEKNTNSPKLKSKKILTGRLDGRKRWSDDQQEKYTYEYVEALKNGNKYTLIGLINDYNWKLEETDE